MSSRRLSEIEQSNTLLQAQRDVHQQDRAAISVIPKATEAAKKLEQAQELLNSARQERDEALAIEQELSERESLPGKIEEQIDRIKERLVWLACEIPKLRRQLNHVILEGMWSPWVLEHYPRLKFWEEGHDKLLPDLLQQKERELVEAKKSLADFRKLHGIVQKFISLREKIAIERANMPAPMRHHIEEREKFDALQKAEVARVARGKAEAARRTADEANASAKNAEKENHPEAHLIATNAEKSEAIAQKAEAEAVAFEEAAAAQPLN